MRERDRICKAIDGGRRFHADFHFLIFWFHFSSHDDPLDANAVTAAAAAAASAAAAAAAVFHGQRQRHAELTVCPVALKVSGILLMKIRKAKATLVQAAARHSPVGHHWEISRE